MLSQRIIYAPCRTRCRNLEAGSQGQRRPEARRPPLQNGWASPCRASRPGWLAEKSHPAKPHSGCSNGSSSTSVNKTPLAVRQTPPRARPKSADQVMKNKLKSVRMGSKSAAASQPQTGKGKAGQRPTSVLPNIALFLEEDGGASEEAIHLSKAEYAELKRAAGPTRDGVLMFMARAGLEKARWPGGPGHQPTANSGSPSCLCFFDAGVGELAGQIPLVGKELPSVVVAAYRQRTTVDQFIADAIKEKLSKPVDKSPSSSPALEEEYCMPGGIVLKIADCHGNAVGVTRVDDRKSTRLN